MIDIIHFISVHRHKMDGLFVASSKKARIFINLEYQGPWFKLPIGSEDKEYYPAGCLDFK